MKADLTRDTFHPLKHYSRVLMQQGRVQLDADMNEEASILLRCLRSLAADLIGPAGGPVDPFGNVGFAIQALGSSTTDFQIGFGHYYVNGLLCEADFMPIAIFPTSAATPATYQVMNWNSDFELQSNPYFYQIYDATPGTTPPPTPVLVQIASGSAAQNQITFQSPPNIAGFVTPKLRRLITYLNQPDYINPIALPTSAGYQVYLDVWERAISYAEDDSIREVALGGPDTAARTKLVWQVKWTLPPGLGKDTPPCGTPPTPAPRGWLQARTQQSSPSANPCIINPNARYTGPENQLYRVEINRGGTAGTTSGVSATFKWSRENGSVIFPISSITGPKVVVESLGRDDRFGLEEGDLVEVQDDGTVLGAVLGPSGVPLNLVQNLLSVQSVDPTTMTVLLSGTPNPNVGNKPTLHPLLRRWDQTSGDPAENGLTLDTAGDNCAFVQEGSWMNLEDGVQVQFQPANPVSGATAPVNQYLTGDYWLIPARTATGDVEWPRVLDANGNPETDANKNYIPLALPPHGVTHYYAPLAVVTVGSAGLSVTGCQSEITAVAVPVPKAGP